MPHPQCSRSHFFIKANYSDYLEPPSIANTDHTTLIVFRHSSSSTMPSIDRLCQQLGISHPLDQSTCIGYGQRKPTCGCAVAIASRSQAVCILTTISQDLRDGRRVDKDMLCDVASLLLCKRWHQFQISENVQRWKRGIAQPRAAIPQSPPAATVSSPRTTIPSTQVATTVRSIRSFSDEELTREIRRRTESGRHTELLSAIRDMVRTTPDNDSGRYQAADQRNNTPTTRAPRVAGSDSPRRIGNISSSTQANQEQPARIQSLRRNESRNIDETPNTSPLRSSSSEDSQRRRGVVSTNRTRLAGPSDTPIQSESESESESEDDDEQTYRRFEPLLDIVRQTRVATSALHTNTNSMQETRVTTATQSSSPAPLRQSHLECVVCLFPYEGRRTEHWECAGCRNRVHLGCFNHWCASMAPAKTCVHCRADVVE